MINRKQIFIVNWVFSIILVLTILILPNFFSFAQQATPEQEKIALEKELKEIEEKIRQYEVDITKTKAEIQGLKNQISTLRNRIGALDLQIRRSNVVIESLGLQIKDTEYSIEKTSLKIEDLKDKLANILQTIYQEDQISFAEILLSGETLSYFFDNLMALETLNLKSQELLENINDLKLSLGIQKERLGGEKDTLEKTVKSLSYQKQESEVVRREQERLMGMTEVQHQQYIEQKKITEQRAAEIRAKIFKLVGIPEVEMPTFGEALGIARWVQQQTGVRPALLLSIITQESALARNVGQCYLVNLKSGTTYHISTKRQFPRGINPTRDLPPFLQITKELGRDPLQTPISCWIDVGRGPNFGWGGAMGPAQFIPSTWMSVKNRISSITGSSPANPWSVRDSFLASGLYLRDMGASSNELLAAGRYFGAPGLLSYDSTVIRRANCLQVFIDQGTISAECERLVFAP
jgi:peptidoglycan hydrolase CwlO-like protein